jgi:hypothetical protein
MDKRTEAPVTCRLQPYTSKDLYNLYGINEKTFRKWIEPFSGLIGEKRGAYFNLRQVEVIFDKLGTPGKMYEFQ